MSPAVAEDFRSRMQPAVTGAGFSMLGYYVWCGSPIRDEDGLFHLFASRWPDDVAFNPYWLTHSEVVRATSRSAEGPYEFQEVVLAPGNDDAWDARMTHNPTVHKIGADYVLFYTGTRYEGPQPTSQQAITYESAVAVEARANQRIGVATAPRLEGPWTRRSRPVLEPRAGQWDALMTTNPAVCLAPDGDILLIYKSTSSQSGLLRLGAAASSGIDAVFTRLSSDPILSFRGGNHVEDPYVWREADGYRMLMKDMRGGIGGEEGAGLLASSADGITWQMAEPPSAYSRNISWDDGRQENVEALERPQLLFQDGSASHLFASLRRRDEDSDSWSSEIVVFPLSAEQS